MGRRLNLHEELCEVLGSKRVYFQPPENVKLEYPCIIYSRSSIDTRYANNKVYRYTYAYELMVIGDDPDETISDALLNHFSMIRHGRHFVSDNLNHDTFILYY